jgi:dienelactone hydrolase
VADAREQVSFGSGGATVAGYLHRPAAPTAAGAPCVVLGHGFTGTMDRLFRYAERFAAAGMAALVFDYRGFGASGGRPRQVIDIPGQLADWRAAIRFARSHPRVDPARVALWGSSLGGGHAITVAAQDPAVAAVVAQVPWLGDGRTLGQKVRQAAQPSALRLAAAAVRDAVRARRGREPLLVPVVGAAGDTAMFTDPRARLALAANDTDATSWRNAFAPRFVFELPRYRPATVLDRLAMPVLVCVARDDREIPIGYVRAAMARAAKGDLRSYPGSHFEIYHGPVYEQVVTDQVGFLRDHLAVGVTSDRRAASSMRDGRRRGRA